MAEVVKMFNAVEEEVILTKEEHIKNFLKDLDESESAMEPFKEHKREVRKSDIDQLVATYDQVKKMVF